MNDDAIPAFLRLTPEERRAAWVALPPTTPAAQGQGYERTETERLYWESVAADKAKQRIKDERRWKQLRERKEAEKAETKAIWTKGNSKCKT